MNQRELAGITQVSEATISRLISGQRRPGLLLMSKIKQALGWSSDAQLQALEAGTYGVELDARLETTLLKKAS